jgi:adenylate kinase
VRVILLGAPGSGKSTQAVLLAKHLGVPALSSGALLRDLVATDSDLAAEIAGHIDRGDLVPDDVVEGIVLDAVDRAAGSGGYVLEGFPRTLTQARRAEATLAPDVVLDLVVPDDVARARLGLRAATGRSDDAATGVVEQRLRRFHEEIDPILRHYRQRELVTSVDADRPAEAVHEAVLHALTIEP